jgi:hypothetical protein
VSGLGKLLRYVEFEESFMFGVIMWNLYLLVFSLKFIVVSLLFYGFLSVLAWCVALFFTVLRIDFVVYRRLPCGFVAGKLLHLTVLLAGKKKKKVTCLSRAL